MHICIYGQNLSVFTSGFPMRGLVKRLIKSRPLDQFTIIIRNDDLKNKFEHYYLELSTYNNVTLIKLPFNKRLSQLKLMLGFKNYNEINFNADLYFTPSVDFFGTKNKPIINILGDLSSIRVPELATLQWHGKIMLRKSLSIASKYADHIACISNYTKLDLLKLYPKIANRCSVLYNGIEDEWFDDKYEKICVEDFTDSTNGYWIWYGFISKRKNILNLLKAYKELSDHSTKTILPKILLVGKIAPNQTVITNFITDNLNGLVKIIPHQHIYKLKYLIKNSKGLLFPSYYEGFGLPVIEAYSQGIPVMHSNVTSLPEIAGGLGISCNPYDKESIKKALVNMSELKDSEDDIFKRKQWASSFTYEKAAQEFSKIIDEVMALNI